jgi:hypothetical protein
MIHGVRIVRVASQDFFEILHGDVIVHVVKPLEGGLVLRVSRAEYDLAEGIGGQANSSQDSHQ